MADDTKPPTQGERLSTVEEELSKLNAWGDEVQEWIDAHEAQSAEHREKNGKTAALADDTAQRLATLEDGLRVLLDHTYGVNVRPPGFFDHTTRVPDPDDAGVVAAREAEASAAVAAPEASTPDTTRLDALESKLDRLLSALAKD